MARPGNVQRRNPNSVEQKMTKADFVAEVENMGMTVRQERRRREGWNDSHATFVVAADGSEHMVSDKMRSDRVDWNWCAAEAGRFTRGERTVAWK